MIGRLCGMLLDKQPPQLLLDVAGVAYEVQASMTTFYHLPEVGQALTLHTHFVVREDAQSLYGFYNLAERELFRALIKINGVGPRMALTILSSISPDEFVACVAREDTASLVRLPGVGKKTAERLMIEMRDRLDSWSYAIPHTDLQAANAAGQQRPARSINQEAINALIALGYKPQEASRAVQPFEDKVDTVEQLIRAALQSMAK